MEEQRDPTTVTEHSSCEESGGRRERNWGCNWKWRAVRRVNVAVETVAKPWLSASLSDASCLVYIGVRLVFSSLERPVERVGEIS